MVVNTVTPALGKLRQKDYELEASLGYTARPYLKTTTTKKKFCPKISIQSGSQCSPQFTFSVL
jgi:hypothetical protein